MIGRATDRRHTTGRVSSPLRPVFCALNGLHRCLDVADAAVAGRFLHGGIELDVGSRPDWLTVANDIDEEWAIEFVKLYEGLDLGAAFAATGDRRYLEAWEDLVESFCDQVPVGHHSSDVSARRVQNWIYAWGRFADSPAFTGLRSGLDQRLVERIRADVDHIDRHLTPERNHRTLELYTLVVAGEALGDCHRLQTALDLLAANASADILDDGVHREQSSDYHAIVLRSLVGAIVVGTQAGATVPPALIDRAGRAATVAMHLQRPDGTMPALSDGDQGDFRTLLALAAKVFDRADLAWAASLGHAGRPPTDRGRTFPLGGYVVQRSGWGDDSRPYEQEAWSVLDCGPLGDGGHGHYDQLSLELYGGGRTLAVDPGRYTYADGPDCWRHWFKGTAAHNTVTVDGRDQVAYRPGKPRGPLPQARLLGRIISEACDVTTACATSPVHDARHTRTVTLTRRPDPWWLIEDELGAATEHRYELRWHLDPTAWGHLSRRDTPTGVEIGLPGGRFTFLDPPGPVSIESGWVSPRYGTRLPAPIITVRTPTLATARFTTQVTPC